jgi:hypothetical protein
VSAIVASIQFLVNAAQYFIIDEGAQQLVMTGAPLVGAGENCIDDTQLAGGAESMKKQLKAFRKKFHRDPGPYDPIFFDPDADSQQPPSEANVAAMFTEMIDAAKEADISPAYIYAMRKTGRMVTERNKHFLSAEDLAEWVAAIEEFKSLD